MEKRKFGVNYTYKNTSIRIRSEVHKAIVDYNVNGTFSSNLDDLICDYFDANGKKKPKKSKATSKPTKTKKERSEKQKEIAKMVRQAYIKSFVDKYGDAPKWAAKENKLVYDLIEALGGEEAINVATFYPSYLDSFHQRNNHPFSLLVLHSHQVLIGMKNPNSSLYKYQIDQQGHEIAKKKNLELAARRRIEQAEREERLHRRQLEEFNKHMQNDEQY